MADEDVVDAARVDLAVHETPDHAEAAPRVEQQSGRARLDEDAGLVALGVERAAGAEKDHARPRHRARA
jgi:hypothetical protein